MENVSKRYGDFTAVADLTLSVAAGETLVLLGTSGSGKTTTLRLLNGLIRPSEGEVRIHGRPISAQNMVALRRQMGYVIQNGGLLPHRNVASNIETVPRLLGWPKVRRQARTTELLELVGLAPELARRKPAELSGGQQQRVGIARALAADPPTLLLDEPFGALDPVTRRQLQLEFKALAKRLSKTVVLVTHDVNEAVLLGDRIALLDKGRLQQLGPARALIFQPANDFVRSFFRANRFYLELSVLRLEEVLPLLPGIDVSPVGLPQYETATPLNQLMDNPALDLNDPFFIPAAERVTTPKRVLQAYATLQTEGQLS